MDLEGGVCVWWGGEVRQGGKRRGGQARREAGYARREAGYARREAGQARAGQGGAGVAVWVR